MTPNIIKGEKDMSKWDKLIQRIKFLDKNIRFEEIQKVLEYYGYKVKTPRSGSSHYTFRKTGKAPITIPKHKYIKTVYVEIVRDVIEEEEKRNENS